VTQEFATVEAARAFVDNEELSAFYGSTVSHHAIITLAIRLFCSAVASRSDCQASLDGCSRRLIATNVAATGFTDAERYFERNTLSAISARVRSQARGRREARGSSSSAAY
jgi:hypothetical protein